MSCQSKFGAKVKTARLGLYCKGCIRPAREVLVVVRAVEAVIQQDDGAPVMFVPDAAPDRLVERSAATPKGFGYMMSICGN